MVFSRVFERCRVTSWKRLFPQPMKEDLAGLERVYTLSSDSTIDVVEAIRAFSVLTDLVQYAEPDKPATIQSGGRIGPDTGGAK